MSASDSVEERVARALHARMASCVHDDSGATCKDLAAAVTSELYPVSPPFPSPVVTEMPHVMGRCPGCGIHNLFLNQHSYVTCGNPRCTEPDALLNLLEGPEYD